MQLSRTCQRNIKTQPEEIKQDMNQKVIPEEFSVGVPGLCW